MTQHTPGSWDDSRIYPSGVYGEAVPIYGSKGHNERLVAMVIDHGNEDEKRANACLIAAAPDLLAAMKGSLERLMDDHYRCNIKIDDCRLAEDESHSLIREVCDVISKATTTA